MGTKHSPYFASFLLSLLVLHLCLRLDVVDCNEREALEIIIGGGSGSDTPPAPSPEYYAPSPEYADCPPPPPPPCPPPPPPPCPPPPPPPCPPPQSPPPPPPSPPPPPPPPSPPPPPPSPPPPRPPPPPPPRPTPLNTRLAIALRAIRYFQKFIGEDPDNITSTWNGNNPCKFTGFICGQVPVYNQQALAGVNFNGRKLAGKRNVKGQPLPLEGFVDKLPDLVFFHANSNNFTGKVPKAIFSLPYFYELDLSNNKLAGQFPYEVLSAPNLTFLDLRFNGYQGLVPPQVFLYSDIDVVFLNNNNFYGNIPDTIGSSTAHYLTFANNHFSGSIPSSIGKASNTLFEVLFLKNQLSGCLPMEIGKLKKATLFDASDNQLTGPIPQSFACLTSMDLLVLDSNQFYGAVPELVCKLTSLSNLSLTNNYFTQVGPFCRKLIKKGILRVGNNCILDLENQRPKSECASFFSKPRNCPNEKSLLYVPCKGRYTSELNKLEQRGQAASAPLSYASLQPHNR